MSADNIIFVKKHRKKWKVWEQSASCDPKRVLKDKQEQHEAECGELDFIAAHLVPTEEYLLDSSALCKLGISKRGY